MIHSVSPVSQRDTLRCGRLSVEQCSMAWQKEWGFIHWWWYYYYSCVCHWCRRIWMLHNHCGGSFYFTYPSKLFGHDNVAGSSAPLIPLKTITAPSSTTTSFPRQSTGKIHKTESTRVALDTEVGDDGALLVGSWCVVECRMVADFGAADAFPVTEHESVCAICCAEYQDADCVQRNSYNDNTTHRSRHGHRNQYCNHMFHQTCIVAWLDTDSRECPCCRAAFVVREFVTL